MTYLEAMQAAFKDELSKIAEEKTALGPSGPLQELHPMLSSLARKAKPAAAALSGGQMPKALSAAEKAYGQRAAGMLGHSVVPAAEKAYALR